MEQFFSNSERILTRNRVGESRGVPVNERVLDVSSADSVSPEENERLPTVLGKAHHLIFFTFFSSFGSQEQWDRAWFCEKNKRMYKPPRK